MRKQFSSSGRLQDRFLTPAVFFGDADPLAPFGDVEEKPCGRTYETERDVFSNHAGTKESTAFRRVKWATRVRNS